MNSKTISLNLGENDNIPAALENITQICIKTNGESWIVPPAGKGDSYKLVEPILDFAALFDKMYPIGSVYINTSDGRNPKDIFGVSNMQWEAYGQGRVLIGEGISDQTFTAGTSGGASSVGLSINNIPEHTHTIQYGGGTQSYYITRVATASVNGGQSSTVLGINYNTTTNTPHNNLPPYIVVYMWKRIA